MLLRWKLCDQALEENEGTSVWACVCSCVHPYMSVCEHMGGERTITRNCLLSLVFDFETSSFTSSNSG